MSIKRNYQKPIVPKMTKVERLRALILVATLTVCVTLAVGGISGGQLLKFGRSLALISVGMMQPEGGAQVLSERLDKLPAGQGGNDQKTNTSYATGGDTRATDTGKTTSGVVPAEAGDGGKVIEEAVTTGSSFVQGVAIKNASSTTIDVAGQIAIAPAIKIKKNTSEPQVLIMHTHTTEAYMTYYAGYYNASDILRTQDTTRSVVAVGESIAEQLRLAGIGVIHDTTVCDYPKYTGAYDRSAAVVTKILKQYPTIQVVLDIHRDSMNRTETQKIKPTAVINGHKAAQIMILTSVCNSKSEPHPDWKENLRFALRLQSSLNTQYAGIVRPLYLVDSRYNQHLTHGSLLIEVGSDANTVSEAVYSGQILGKTLSQVLNTFQ